MRTFGRKRTQFGAVVVDMQREFLREIGSSERKSLLENHRDMLSFLAKKRIPVVFLEYCGGGETYPPLKSGLSEIRVVKKATDDGFPNTNLDRFLKSLDVTDIVLMGIYASDCIKKNALGALARGYFVHTSRDLMANRPDAYSQQCFDKDLRWYRRSCFLYDSSEGLRYRIKQSPRSVR